MVAFTHPGSGNISGPYFLQASYPDFELAKIKKAGLLMKLKFITGAIAMNSFKCSLKNLGKAIKATNIYVVPCECPI